MVALDLERIERPCPFASAPGRPIAGRPATWVVDYRDQAHRHLKTYNRKREADAEYARITVDVNAGIHIAASRNITVAEAGQLWLGESGSGRHRTRHVGELPGAPHAAHHAADRRHQARELTVPFVRKFEDRLRQDRSAAMTRKILTSLSGILADAQDRGLVAQNVIRNRRARKTPARPPKTPARSRRRYSDAGRSAQHHRRLATNALGRCCSRRSSPACGPRNCAGCAGPMWTSRTVRCTSASAPTGSAPSARSSPPAADARFRCCRWW